MDRRVEPRIKAALDEDCYPNVDSEILRDCPMIKFAEKTREHGLLLSAEWVLVITGCQGRKSNPNPLNSQLPRTRGSTRSWGREGPEINNV